MYLRNVYIENNGPIKNLSFEIPQAISGVPKPLILVGGNGSGKTNLLSIIADSLFEASVIYFNDTVKQGGGIERPYFRILGAPTISAGSSGGCVLLKFEDNDTEYFYKEKSGKLPYSEAQKRIPDSFQQAGLWNDNEDVKQFILDEGKVKTIFQSGVYVYFPSSRSETPHWLN